MVKKKVVFQSDLLLHLEIVMLSFCYGKKHYNEEVFTLCFSFVMVKIIPMKNHNNKEVFTLLLQCKRTCSLQGVSVEGIGEW